MTAPTLHQGPDLPHPPSSRADDSAPGPAQSRSEIGLLIIERYSAGGNISILSLAREFHVSRKFVYRTLASHSVPLRLYTQKKPPREALCVGCGKAFVIKRGRTAQRFCSRDCAIKRRPENAERYRRRLRRCPTCGEQFHRYNREQIYCSRRCYLATRRKVCPICGRDYVPRRRPGREQPYCSAECRQEAFRSAQPLCKGCGKRLPIPAKRWRRRSPFCSPECKAKFLEPKKWTKQRVEKELAEAIRENSGLFPSFEQLHQMRKSALASKGIGKFGGFPYWRRHFGFEGVYVLADGHTIVKSAGELVLGNVLLLHGVPFLYEAELFGTAFKCDFKIPGARAEEDVYIEHYGNKGERQHRHFMGRGYLARWRQKLRLYRTLGCVDQGRLIITRDDEISGQVYKHQLEHLSRRLGTLLQRGDPGMVPTQLRDRCLHPTMQHVEIVIEKRLRQVVDRLGSFPTSTWLQKHSPGLATAIGRHGGINAWRQRFRAKVIKQPPRYWDDPRNIEAALGKVIRECEGKFPTRKWLEQKRYFALLVALSRHGGTPYWRGRMGFPALKKPMGYWKKEENVRAALGRAIRQFGKGFPTCRWLQQNGFSSLVRPLQERGHGYWMKQFGFI